MTNRLALAKTLVSGTVTLQGFPYSFTASASGTATGPNIPIAKKAATVASNSAAVTAARASIDKILDDNSTILSDLEITSLISNNLSTTVRVFKPIGLDQIATSNDGVYYTLKPNVTIGTNQWLRVPSGKTLHSSADNPLINKGYIQYGDTTSKSSGALKSTTCANCSSGAFTNSGTIEISQGECYTVDSGTDNTNSGTVDVGSGGCFIINSGLTLTNSGSFTNNGSTTNNGTFTNSGEEYSNIFNAGGSFTNSIGARINNSSYGSNFTNVCNVTFINDGDIDNSGGESSSCPWTSGGGSCSGSCNEACTPPPPPPPPQ